MSASDDKARYGVDAYKTGYGERSKRDRALRPHPLSAQHLPTVNYARCTECFMPRRHARLFSAHSQLHREEKEL